MRFGYRIRSSHLRALSCLVGAVSVLPAAGGLTINLSYDSSVTSLPYASDVENATQYAATQLQNVLTNNVTININVVASDNAFGGSGTGLGGIYSYTDIRNFLTSHATTPVDTSAVAMMNALPDPTQGGNFWIPGAEMKVLGLSDPNGTGNDGTFTFGTNNPWNFSITNRSVAGEYDFVGVALHELTECIGRTSVLGGSLNNAPGWIPFDLFRFTQPGFESTNNHDNGVYFSVDQGNTNLKNYNPASNGGDLQDWAAGTPDAADQASVQGTENDLSPADIATLDAIGYTPVTASRTLTWDGSNSLVDASHWLNSSNQNVPAYIGASLVVNSGTLTYTPPDVVSNLVFSNTSIYGTGLTINGGSVSTLVNTFVSGLGTGTGAGLYLTTGSSLSISGTGQLKLAGELVIGGDSGSNVTATISGGSLLVGQNNSSNVNPTLYVGLSGTGSLTQSGNSTVTTGNLIVAANNASHGSYQLQGGTLSVTGITVIGGTSGSPTTGSGTLSISGGNMQTSMLKAWSGTLTLSAGSLTVTGLTTNDGTFQQTGGTASFATIYNVGASPIGSMIIGNASGASATLTAASINQNSLTINNTGSVTIDFGPATASTLQSLSISGNGLLNLTGNVLHVAYTAGHDPVTKIRGLLVSGYNHGAWNGPGINSSTAAASAHKSTTLGYVDSSNQVLVQYTWVGDANLDGVVNSADLAAIKSNGTTWATGDFNYDGVVNADDYGLYLLGAAYGKVNISTTLPEPCSVMIALLGGLSLKRRRPAASAIFASSRLRI